jgi:thymidine phosphorylase
MTMKAKPNMLRIKTIGINTYRENIIYIHADCPVSRSEGFTALTRIEVNSEGRKIIATLNVVVNGLLTHDEAGLSTEAMSQLGVKDGDLVTVSHLQPVRSLGMVRAKMYGRELDEEACMQIISDIAAGRYSNVELAAFVTACAGDNLSVKEITGLTKAMIASGHKLSWNSSMVLDKHSIGGLPGNRTTPIVVSIIAAAGLMIPKTSSRAITSPAGTADTVAMLTNVDLSLNQIRKTVTETGGCLAWGGSVGLSPADDILISVEKALDVDSGGQMVASVLSKKAAAGSTHVLIDIPVGPTAKVRQHEEALKLQYFFKAVGEAIGMHVETVITDGMQPVGRGIGPALEAMDILAVLRNQPGAPADLKERAVLLAGMLLELSGKYNTGRGKHEALKLLDSGDAYRKFMEICKIQGWFTEPVYAEYKYDVLARADGMITAIDNRELARVAKLGGAPKSPSAGILYLAPIGKRVKKGDVLFTIYAEAPGELNYAREYLQTIPDLITIETT